MTRFTSFLLYCFILSVLVPHNANASTRYYQPRSKKPSVEIDLSILGQQPPQERGTTFPKQRIMPKAVPKTMAPPPLSIVPRVDFEHERLLSPVPVKNPRLIKRIISNAPPVTPIIIRPIQKPVKVILYKGTVPMAKPPRGIKTARTPNKTPLIKPVMPAQRKIVIEQEAPIAPVLSAFPDKPLLEKPKVKAMLIKPLKMAPVADQEIEKLPEPEMALKDALTVETETESAIEEEPTEIIEASEVQPTGIEDILALPVEAVEQEIVVAPKPDLSEIPSLKDLSLEFTGSSSELSSGAKKQLDKIVIQLEIRDSQRLQLRAYAIGADGSRSSARRLSLARALAVRSYLMDKGIRPTRVDVRALGSETDRTPIDRVDMIFIK